MKHCFTKNTWSCKFLATDGSVFVIFAQHRRAWERKHSAGLLGKRDGRPASCWIIQNSPIQTHLCIECLLCVETAIFCSGRVTQSGPVWPLITPNYFTGVFLLLLSSPEQSLCVGESLPGRSDSALAAECRCRTKALGLWHVTVLMVKTLRFRLTAEISAANLLYSLVEILWPQGAALIPTNCCASAFVQNISRLLLTDVRLSSTSAAPLQFIILQDFAFSDDCLVLTEPSVNGLVASIEVKSNSIFTLRPDKEPC